MHSRTERFICDDCKHTFRSKESLILHIEGHNKKSDNKKEQYYQFKCNICNKTYTSNRNVKRHIEMIHGEKTNAIYKCELCPKFYNTNHSLTRHVKSIHCVNETIEKQYRNENEILNSTVQKNSTLPQSFIEDIQQLSCKCGLAFENEPSLRNHIKNDHSFETYYEYGMKYLRRHSKYLADFPVLTYSCELCLLFFSTDVNLKDHLKVLHGKEYHVSTCNICNRKFDTQEKRDAHRKICVAPDNPYSCQFCDKLFTRLCSLEFHTQIFHPENQIADSKISSTTKLNGELCSFKCQFCDRKYYSDRSLKHHIKLKHTTDEAVECEECGKICSNKYYLIAHMKTCHNTDQLWQCDHCEKQFKSKRNIKRHIEYTHLGKQRYKCIECDKLFKEKRSLRKHLRIKHADSTLFPHCQFCDKIFESAKAYQIHLKLAHSYSVNSHPCDLCSVSFTSFDALKIHLETTHLAEDVIFKCEPCNMLFNGQDKFDKHNEVTHSEVIEEEKMLPRCILCMKDFRARKTLRRHIRKFHSSFDAEELADYGTTQRTFNVDCEECIKTFNNETYYKLYFKLGEPTNTQMFKCEFCGNSYTQLEYLIQRYRHSELEGKDQMMLSELCTTQMSDDELNSDDQDLVTVTTTMINIKTEPAELVETESM